MKFKIPHPVLARLIHETSRHFTHRVCGFQLKVTAEGFIAVAAFDLQHRLIFMSAPCEVTSPGAIWLKADAAAAIVPLLKGGDLEVEEDDGVGGRSLRFYNPQQRAACTLPEVTSDTGTDPWRHVANEIAERRQLTRVEINATEIRDAIRHVRRVAGQDDSRPDLAGIRIVVDESASFGAVAADGFRLHACGSSLKDEAPGAGLTVDLRTIRMVLASLKRAETVHLAHPREQRFFARFKAGQFITQVIGPCKVAYPDYLKVMPDRRPDVVATFSRAAALSVIERLERVIGVSFSDGVEVTLRPDFIRISSVESRNPYARKYATADCVLAAEVEGLSVVEGLAAEARTFFVSLRYLGDAIRSLPAGDVRFEFRGELAQLVFSSVDRPGFTVVVMPRRK